jgi:hypothetical protein
MGNGPGTRWKEPAIWRLKSSDVLNSGLRAQNVAERAEVSSLSTSCKQIATLLLQEEYVGPRLIASRIQTAICLLIAVQTDYGCSYTGPPPFHANMRS